MPSLGKKMSQTERVIGFVKENRLLYDYRDPLFKNTRAKDNKWKELANILNNNPEILKRQWKNLKDSYSRYLKSQKANSGQAASRYRNWQWAQDMDFMKPYIAMTETAATLDTIETKIETKPTSTFSTIVQCNVDDVLDEEINETIEGAQSPSTETLSFQFLEMDTIKEEETSVNSSLYSIDNVQMDKDISYLEETKSLDAVDYLFMSWALTAKTFSAVRLIETKKKIADIMFDQERDHLEEIMNQQSTSFKC